MFDASVALLLVESSRISLLGTLRTAAASLLNQQAAFSKNLPGPRLVRLSVQLIPAAPTQHFATQRQGAPAWEAPFEDLKAPIANRWSIAEHVETTKWIKDLPGIRSYQNYPKCRSCKSTRKHLLDVKTDQNGDLFSNETPWAFQVFLSSLLIRMVLYHHKCGGLLMKHVEHEHTLSHLMCIYVYTYIMPYYCATWRGCFIWGDIFFVCMQRMHT